MNVNSLEKCDKKGIAAILFRKQSWNTERLHKVVFDETHSFLMRIMKFLKSQVYVFK